MKNTYFAVTRTNGKRSRLVSNDTITLAFCPGMTESTPITLRALVAESSLRRLAAMGHEKAEKALAYRIQKSTHGAGLISIQVFDSSDKLVGDFYR